MADINDQISKGRELGLDNKVPADFNDGVGFQPGAQRNKSYSTSPTPNSRPRGEEDPSNVLYFPFNLGSVENQHFVEFAIFDLKNEDLNKTSAGDRFVMVKDKNTGESKPVRTKVSGSRNTTFQDFASEKLSLYRYAKLNTLIALPMPATLLVDHSTLWSKAEGGLIQGATDLLNSFSEQSVGDAALKAAKTAALRASSGITSFLSSFGAEGSETAFKLATKRAVNPRNEFLFSGVNNRSFNMEWTFIPNNAKEAEKLFQILDKLKIYMYPEIDQTTNGGFYMFPALFEIKFKAGDIENEWLYKTSSCALTNMTVNFTSLGQWIAMSENAAPAAVSVILQFVETEFLHRKRFLEGVVR